MATAVDHVEIRYRTASPVGAWTTLILPAGQRSVNIEDVSRGSQLDIQARSVGKNGVASAWVQQDHTVAAASSAWSVLGNPNQTPIGPTSLYGEAPTDSTGQITCLPFTSLYGLSYFPGGAQVITGLSQGSSYYVYVIDPTTSGGDLTPNVTQDPSEFVARIGYFYIGSVTVPEYEPPPEPVPEH